MRPDKIIITLEQFNQVIEKVRQEERERAQKTKISNSQAKAKENL